MKSQETRRPRTVRKGTVHSSEMDKTIIVEVKRRFRHPLYKKVVQARNRFAVHDEENKARPGDIVEIMKTRPLSRTKRWRLTRILKSTAAPEDRKK